MIKINEENIAQVQNPNIDKIFKKYQIFEGLGRENKYSYSVITLNKELSGIGIFPWGEVSNVKKKNVKFNKYLINKEGTIYDFNESIKDNEERIDFNEFTASMGINIETGEHLDIDLIKQVHTAVVGGTGSGKSVFLTNIIYQMLRNKYTELYIIDKVDFGILKGTKKCAYRNAFSKLTNKDIISFLNFFFLEYSRRQDIFNKYGVSNWSQYEKMRKDNPDMEKLNFIFVLFDEYQTLRKQFGSSGKLDVLDLMMKQLMDTVRSTGIIFYFGTQDFKMGEIGDILTSIITTYSGSLKWHTSMTNKDLEIVKKCINGTYLFYDHERKILLKAPHSNSVTNLLKKEANNPDNIFVPIKQYDNLPEMLSDSLEKITSDIFEDIDLFMLELNIKKDYIQKLKRSSEYIPFCILFYSIFRLYRENKIIGKNTDIFANIDSFPLELDALLFSKNIDFYKDNKKLVKSIEEVLELGQDKEEFVEAIGMVLNNYLGTSLGTTSFKPKVELLKEPTAEELIEVEKKVELNKNTLIEIGYSGEIKPVSFNSMYYIEKGENIIRKSPEATKYEAIIKKRIVNKMVASNINQTKNPVILDIEFTLGLPVKKDGELSNVGKNDLDNLLKATIDGINNTIIKDDVQVYGIRTKINYIEKHSSHHKNNKVSLKIVKLNQETFNEYKNKFSKEVPHTPIIDIPIKKGMGINIPSVNNMYFIDTHGKKRSSSNTLKYERYLGNYVNKYKENGHIKTTSDDLLLFLNFSVSNPEERDLDNMLKATIDSMSEIVFTNDKQIREIVCFKNKISDPENYIGNIKMGFFKYDILKEIKVNKSEDTDNVFEIKEESFNPKSIDSNKEIEIKKNPELPIVPPIIPNGNNIIDSEDIKEITSKEDVPENINIKQKEQNIEQEEEKIFEDEITMKEEENGNIEQIEEINEDNIFEKEVEEEVEDITEIIKDDFEDNDLFEPDTNNTNINENKGGEDFTDEYMGDFDDEEDLFSIEETYSKNIKL